MGSFLTILVFIVVGAYAYQKTDVWLAKKDVDIMSSTMIQYFDETFEFNHDLGLSLAIAFTAFDNEREIILDRSIGELVFKRYEWGNNEDGTFYLH